MHENRGVAIVLKSALLSGPFRSEVVEADQQTDQAADVRVEDRLNGIVVLCGRCNETLATVVTVRAAYFQIERWASHTCADGGGDRR